MTDHTPGPWIVGGHPRDNSGTAWREVLAPSQFGPSYVCQALQLDAALIAAAPDMLETLKRVLASVEEHAAILERSGGGAWLRQDAKAIRAAIAKATHGTA